MSGRPRLTGPLRAGNTTRDEILDAAAELFTSEGFAATTTRRIAESVGVQQASLYYHFKTKHDILDALLAMTIDQPLHYASLMMDRAEPAVVRLYALMLADATQLLVSRWNLGALYLLPDLRTERFTAFRDKRNLLRQHYQVLTAQVIDVSQSHPGVDGLPFRLVESVIMMRADSERIDAAVLAAATLRMLGVTLDVGPLDDAARELLMVLAWPFAASTR